MTTSRTSSLSSATLAALSDELQKIAEAESKPTRSQRLKKWAKTTALLSGGYAAGHGAAMVGDRLLSKHLGPAYQKLSPTQKKWVIGPALGLATAGSLAAAEHIRKKQREVYEP